MLKNLEEIFLVVFSSALATSVAISILGNRISDNANERSAHTGSKPRVGGIGIAAGLICAFAAHSSFNFVTFAGFTAFFIVGFLDDIKSLKPGTKMLGQITGALLLTLSAPPFLMVLSSYIGILPGFIFTLLIIVTIVNFYNFMDGIDGIIAGNAILQLIFIATIVNTTWPLLYASALAGFLIFNWAPSKTFMGDSGSHLVGAAVAASMLQSGNLWTFLICLLVTLPILGDALFTLLRRILAQDNLLKAHSKHIYQELVKRGFGHAEVTSYYMLSTLLLGFFAVIYHR